MTLEEIKKIYFELQDSRRVTVLLQSERQHRQFHTLENIQELYHYAVDYGIKPLPEKYSKFETIDYYQKAQEIFNIIFHEVHSKEFYIKNIDLVNKIRLAMHEVSQISELEKAIDISNKKQERKGSPYLYILEQKDLDSIEEIIKTISTFPDKQDKINWIHRAIYKRQSAIISDINAVYQTALYHGFTPVSETEQEERLSLNYDEAKILFKKIYLEMKSDFRITYSEPLGYLSMLIDEAEILQNQIEYFNERDSKTETKNDIPYEILLIHSHYPKFNRDIQILKKSGYLQETESGFTWLKSKKSLAEYFDSIKTESSHKWTIVEKVFQEKNLKNSLDKKYDKQSKDFDALKIILNTPES